MWWKLVDDKVNRPNAMGREMEKGYTAQICSVFLFLLLPWKKPSSSYLSLYGRSSITSVLSQSFLELMFHLKKWDNIFNLATQLMFFIHQTILNQLQFTATVILKKTIIVGKIANKFIRQCPMNFQNFKILQPSNKNNNDTHLQWKTKSNLT